MTLMTARRDPPVAVAVVAAHDRDEPAGAALAAADREAAGRALPGGREVGDDRHELALRACRVGRLEALLELVHRDAALGGGRAQALGGALAVVV
jgi:hypothetical protein